MTRSATAYGIRSAMWWTTLAMVFACGALPSTRASADQVVLRNGDRLDGHVVMLDAGKLTINVLGLGDVKVDVAQIATVSTDGPVELRLADGTTERRKLNPSTRVAGQVVIADPYAVVPDLPTPLADIRQVNPPSPWTGAISAGALLIRGNTNTDSVNLNVNLVRKTTEDTLAFTGAYLYGRTHDRDTGQVTTTADNWQIESRYDYNFTPRFYGFLDFLVRKDTIAFLDLRLVPSGGLGYKFVNQPMLTVTGEAGIAWVYERYTNDTPTKEDVSARLAYHVNKKFSDTVWAFHNLEYLQSVERSGNFLFDTDIGLHAQINKHFFAEAKVTLDYDHNPALIDSPPAPPRHTLQSEVFYAVNLGYTL